MCVGAGEADPGQPCGGGERRNRLRQDDAGHAVYPGRLHQARHGLARQGGVHAAPPHQRHIGVFDWPASSCYRTRGFSNAAARAVMMMVM